MITLNVEKKDIYNTSTMRYETPKGKQAQLDWKKSIDFILNTGENITINIFVLILSYSRFRVYKLSLEKSQEILFHFLMKLLKPLEEFLKNY